MKKSRVFPKKLPLLKANRKGIPVISEIEFAIQFTDATTVGITGSNGKTTTTLLTYHLLKQGGLNVGISWKYWKKLRMASSRKQARYLCVRIE